MIARVILLAAIGSLFIATAVAADPPYKVERFLENPVITPGMMGNASENINGPSLIQAPDWVPGKLGKYYLYFAHHEGDHIRLAYANNLHGPWTIYRPGVLYTKDLPWHPDHVASPDVIVDNDRREIRVYFHSPVTPAPKSSDPLYREKLADTRQDSFVAVSKDGLHFEVRSESLGPSYFRVWKWNGYYYALPRLGTPLLRSKDGFAPFLAAPVSPLEHDPAFKNIRHVAVLVDADKLVVFYSRIGDAPEQIYMTEIKLTSNWENWQATPPKTVLRPETGYEGVALPLTPSLRGTSTEFENAVRDPAVFQEDGKLYLLYSVEGERGIAIATVTPAKR
jgi:hypothetical protein